MTLFFTYKDFFHLYSNWKILQEILKRVNQELWRMYTMKIYLFRNIFTLENISLHFDNITLTLD